MKPGIKKWARLLITRNQQSGKKQDGIALLVLVIVIALTLSAYYFSSISVVDIKIDNLDKTRAALKQAKKALINYAVMHADGISSGDAGEFGYLPCPHIAKNSPPAEGEQQVPNCGAGKLNSIGYLPWKSLDTGVLRDGSGNCLWYAVSSSYKNAVYAGLINEDTNGMFQVVDSSGTIIAGNVPEDRIVAVVFAPGPVLATQTRVFDNTTICGDDGANPSAYLEGNGVTNNAALSGDVDTIDQFLHASITSDSPVPPSIVPPYNDHFIIITRDEIWQAIMRRSDLNNRLSEVTESLAECLAEYVNHAENPNKRLPWPAKSDLEGGDYRIMDNYSDELNALTGYAGRFPFHLDSSNAGIATITNIASEYLDHPTDVICTNLNLSISGVANVNLTDENLEHRIILNNWKDHFFYALSKDYALPDDLHTGCSGDCVSIEDPVGVFTNYAAIVFYSGSPYTGIVQPRNIGDKSDILNYLENGNGALFPDIGGNGVYTTTDPLISNDIMFCLTDNAVPIVVAC